MKCININKYKAIIFDLGGVILNIDYQKTIETFKKLGISDFDLLYTQAKQSNLFDLFETGHISSSEFRNEIRKYKNSLTDEEIDNAWNAMLLDLPPIRITLLKKLKTKIPIYLLSNTNEIHIKAFLKKIEESYGNKKLFDEIFTAHYYSSEIGFRKPNKDCFEYVINQNNLDPSQTLFIDDSIQHVEGAKKAGLHSYHLKEGSIIELFPDIIQ